MIDEHIQFQAPLSPLAQKASVILRCLDKNQWLPALSHICITYQEAVKTLRGKALGADDILPCIIEILAELPDLSKSHLEKLYHLADVIESEFIIRATYCVIKVAPRTFSTAAIFAKALQDLIRNSEATLTTTMALRDPQESAQLNRRANEYSEILEKLPSDHPPLLEVATNIWPNRQSLKELATVLERDIQHWIVPALKGASPTVKKLEEIYTHEFGLEYVTTTQASYIKANLNELTRHFTNPSTRGILEDLVEIFIIEDKDFIRTEALLIRLLSGTGSSFSSDLSKYIKNSAKTFQHRRRTYDFVIDTLQRFSIAQTTSVDSDQNIYNLCFVLNLMYVLLTNLSHKPSHYLTLVNQNKKKRVGYRNRLIKILVESLIKALINSESPLSRKLNDNIELLNNLIREKILLLKPDFLIEENWRFAAMDKLLNYICVKEHQAGSHDDKMDEAVALLKKLRDMKPNDITEITNVLERIRNHSLPLTRGLGKNGPSMDLERVLANIRDGLILEKVLSRPQVNQVHMDLIKNSICNELDVSLHAGFFMFYISSHYPSMYVSTAHQFIDSVLNRPGRINKQEVNLGEFAYHHAVTLARVLNDIFQHLQQVGETAPNSWHFAAFVVMFRLFNYCAANTLHLDSLRMINPNAIDPAILQANNERLPRLLGKQTIQPERIQTAVTQMRAYDPADYDAIPPNLPLTDKTRRRRRSRGRGSRGSAWSPRLHNAADASPPDNHDNREESRLTNLP